jgi:hypothetical protein
LSKNKNNVDEVSSEEVPQETVSDVIDTVLIYCGPSNNLISRYTSYKNGYPLHLNDHLEKFPILKSLFIEPENFSEFEKNVVEKGSIESIWFEEAKKYFSKVVA